MTDKERTEREEAREMARKKAMELNKKYGIDFMDDVHFGYEDGKVTVNAWSFDGTPEETIARAKKMIELAEIIRREA